MKKFTVLLLIIVLMLILSACQTYLFGEYINAETGIKYEFMNNEYILTDGDTETTGTYTIKKGTIILKHDGIETTYTYERDGTSAIIDGVEYLRGK